MKNSNLFLSLAAGILLFSCSDDDEIQDIPQEPAAVEVSIAINEVEYLGNRVELLNNGNATADIGDFFLCLGPGTYRRVGDLTAVSGSTVLAPGALLVVSYDPINGSAGQIGGQNASGGLGLYSEGGAFANPNTLADFVQWGAAGSVRESVAVQAGIWTAGEFVAVAADANNSIIFDGEGNNASDFAETTSTSFGQENGSPVAPIGQGAEANVVINEVEYLANRIELANRGGASMDVSDYFLCLGPQTYRRVGDLNVVSGSVTIAAGGTLVIEYDPINSASGQIGNQNATGGLGLYTQGGAFGNPDALADFVQWGAAGSVRENVAVQAGLWTAGEFVPVSGIAGNSIIFDGQGDLAANFAETTDTSFGTLDNGDAVAQTAVTSIVINEIEFLGNRVEILNNGTTTEDISDYQLCLAPGTYRRVGGLPVSTGNTTLAPGQILVVEYAPINSSGGQINGQNGTGGLGLYTRGGAFGNPDALADFVQWGAAGSVRESVAVQAGIWTAGQFINVSNNATQTISYDGTGNTVSDFSVGTQSFGQTN